MEQVMRFVILMLLSACLVPKAPTEPKTSRSWISQAAYSATITVWCSELDMLAPHPDGLPPTDTIEWYPRRSGSAVFIDGRHLLTAAHVTMCPVIPTARIRMSDGSHRRVVVVREDIDADVALLEIASAEVLDVVPAKLSWRKDQLRCVALSRGVQCGSGDLLIKVKTQHGDSGAGVYDGDGDLIGVVSGGDAQHGMTAIAPLPDGWLP